MPNNHLEKNLWDAADELRANSKLRASDYSIPVLGLIFLKYADHKFAHATAQFQAQAKGLALSDVEGPSQRRRRRDPPLPDRYKAAGVLYLPDEARFERLVKLPEGENIGRKINAAMKAIEEHNETLQDVLTRASRRPAATKPCSLTPAAPTPRLTAPTASSPPPRSSSSPTSSASTVAARSRPARAAPA